MAAKRYHSDNYWLAKFPDLEHASYKTYNKGCRCTTCRADKANYVNHPRREPAEPLDLTWRAEANCSGVGPENFYIDPGDRQAELKTKEVCTDCVVSEQCLNYAIANYERYGIWGGKNFNERRTISRKRRLALQTERETA